MNDASRIDLFSSTLRNLHEALEECMGEMPLSVVILEDLNSDWEQIRELFSLCEDSIATLFGFSSEHKDERIIILSGVILKQLLMLIMGIHYHSDYDYSSYVVPSRFSRVCFT